MQSHAQFAYRVKKVLVAGQYNSKMA